MGFLDPPPPRIVRSATPPADTSVIWIDTSPSAASAVLFRTDAIPVMDTGDVTLTLDTAPLSSADLTIVLTTAGGTQSLATYTRTGTSVLVPSMTQGSTLTVTYSYPATVGVVGRTKSSQYVVLDRFNRADSTPLGTTETGETWTYGDGATYGVRNNKVYKAAIGPNPTLDGALINYGADLRVEADWTTYDGTSMGLQIRRLNVSNFIFTNATSLVNRLNAVSTTVGTFSTPFVQGDRMALQALGTTITVQRKAGGTGAWTTVLTVTGQTNNQANTLAGIKLNSSTTVPVAASEMDNFLIKAPS